MRNFIQLTRSIVPLLIIAGLTFFNHAALAQSKVKVENVKFFMEGEKLVITYDLNKAKANEAYEISVEIATTAGTKIRAFALSGDVGPNVYGGKYKRIVWNLAEDNIYIDDEIVVEVTAEPMGQKTAATKPDRSYTGGQKSVGGAMLRSLALPGWGNSYAADGGAYWLVGVAGYGCLGATLYFNNASYNSYQDYKEATTAGERDQLFQDASDQKDMQNIFLIAAGAIWVGDIIWSGLHAAAVNKKAAAQSKVMVGSYYDPIAQAPMITLRLRLK
ncbi:MAG: DUF5683 domain-containing protein [Bacteroidales bacterium]|nr:DUF5683 domain-containing protein [Bacteroidales bacterium]NCU35312.1 hypothetical protein [Candidatus Falkowbacteria bacterium]MDD2633237.1 DUF5683 domain-containing protein [Bacteroidales bacterium]MDD3526970.1 DUF5683 domain-containing protein [Bacteroidales bacterium]MDD4177689.1 DUF5683 domain-containing protein [Bacteroidales bacterium]